jgi:hypothetical protein
MEPSVSFSLGTGIDPAVSTGVTAASRITSRWPVSATFSATVWAANSVQFTRFADVVDVPFYAADAALLFGYRVARITTFSLDACAGGAFGLRWIGTSASLVERRNPIRPFVAPTAGVEARFRLTDRWFVVSGLTCAITFPRDHFVYIDTAGDTHSLFTPPRFAGRLALGLGYRV